MSINLLLIESPIGELMARQHHIHSGHRMLQFEVVGLGSQHLSLIAVNQPQVEQGLIVALHLVLGQGSELLVGGVTRGSNIVGDQERVSLSVEELDDVVMTDNPSTTSLGESFGGNDDPVVVLILMGITSDLLALTADPLVGVFTRITLRVRMKQVLGADMLDSNRVKVTNFCRRKPINSSPATIPERNVP